MRAAERNRLRAADAIHALLRGGDPEEEQVGAMLVGDGIAALRQIRKFIAALGGG